MNKNIQALILCGGKGSRLAPLTDEFPKVLLDICGKSILERKLDIIKDLFDEVILIIGYKGDIIKSKIGDNYEGLKILYVEQKELLGTGHAIMVAKNIIKDRFIVMNGDDIYSKSDIKNLITNKYALLSIEVSNPEKFGVLEIESVDNNEGVALNTKLISIVEKSPIPVSNLINIGCYIFDKNIFKINLKLSKRGEYEIVDYLTALISSGETVIVNKVEGNWFPVNNFEELEFTRNQFK